MSLNAAPFEVSTMNSFTMFKRSNDVNTFKIQCLGIMDYIDVNIIDGTNIIQSQIFSTYIFLYCTGMECRFHSNGHSNTGWYLNFKRKQLFDKDRIRVEIIDDQKIKFSFKSVVEDNTVSTVLSLKMGTNKKKINFVKPVDALLIEGA